MRRSNSARPSVGFASLTWRQRLAYLRAWLWCFQYVTPFNQWLYRPTITSGPHDEDCPGCHRRVHSSHAEG